MRCYADKETTKIHMTHEEKLNYMRLAAGMCNFGMTEDQLDLLLSLYDGVLEKEGKFSISDAIDIKVKVKEREARRAVEEEARARNREEQARRDHETEKSQPT